MSHERDMQHIFVGESSSSKFSQFTDRERTPNSCTYVKCQNLCTKYVELTAFVVVLVTLTSRYTRPIICLLNERLVREFDSTDCNYSYHYNHYSDLVT